MSKTHTATATMQMQAISVGQIIMDDSNYLTLWGHVQQDGVWYPCDLVTTYEVMNTMLRYSQEKNDAVQMTIVKRLEAMHQVPELIDLEEELGGAVVFDNMAFYMSRPEHHEWEICADDACYFIQKVVVMPVTPPVPPARAALTEKMEECLHTLRAKFDLYLGFIEIDLEEEAARLKAGLADDLSFSTAYYAWQLHLSDHPE
ncbi:hypothetical protein [Chitinophaga qingshengii]|uniref:Uncharacterized protein n=1 Tax=Chitinophaga qingshengii TaxID=1569794 RepID=A0ABR7TV94_9BACT|nr:hypothetical protein [Chitinophaga qingshengii]MBC9933918.1 hypothetical protein [Chitinophaga qingshengii]